MSSLLKDYSTTEEWGHLAGRVFSSGSLGSAWLSSESDKGWIFPGPEVYVPSFRGKRNDGAERGWVWI